MTPERVEGVGGDRARTTWWQGAVGYQIYVRSFADTDGDGTGDLAGVTAHLDHLTDLGVGIVWLCPFYPSPGFDHGYDVSDYCGVDPAAGTLDDIEALIAAAHTAGLRVLVDVVPNHTSSEHPWFRSARSSPRSPHRDWYLWRDPAPDGGPPNNWVSHFGGPAWTLDEASGQYYCHLFLPEQPDLNWRNPEMVAAFDDALRFWLDRGVDGFRIDVAHGLLKDPEFRDNPLHRPLRHDMGPIEVFRSFDHVHDLDQEGNVDIYAHWHAVAATYGAILLGEVNLRDPARMARVLGPGLLDLAFYLETVWAGWAPERLLPLIRSVHQAAPDRVAWVISNHDASRPVTRYGGGERGRRRALAMTTFLMGLGGVPFVYQGEELGLDDGQIAMPDLADPIATRNVAGAKEARDGSRTAMPWSSGPGNGFTTGTPWLHAAPRALSETVAGQDGQDASPLTRYRALLAARRRHPDLWQAPAVWLETGHPLVAAVQRGAATVVANLGEDEHSLARPAGEVVFATQPDQVGLDGDRLVLGPETSVIMAS